MLSVSYAGKNAYSAGKTSGVLRGGASRANRCYVLAHCGGGGGAQVCFNMSYDCSPYIYNECGMKERS